MALYARVLRALNKPGLIGSLRWMRHGSVESSVRKRNTECALPSVRSARGVKRTQAARERSSTGGFEAAEGGEAT